MKSKKWRFLVVVPVYRGIEPQLAPAWESTLDTMPPSTQAGNVATVTWKLYLNLYLSMFNKNRY